MRASGNQAARLLDDFSERWRRGERVRVELLLGDDLAESNVVLELIHQEVRLRQALGENPQVEEYERRFPHLRAQLRAYFEAERLKEGDPDERLTQEKQPTAAAALPPAAADWAPAIPGYDILRPLAGGGMGMVYRASQQATGRPVAIKVIRPERLGSAAAIRRFQREALIAARLAHPHIVRVFAADQVDGVHYLVMEFIDGTDLGKLVQERGPLAESLACSCIRQAALGLQHAFEIGLVHRDVKPSNLMLGPDGTVKLLDLGLARLREAPESEDSHLTQAGGVLGTPDYMAPEQVEDPHRADVRSDLYSLGCTFFYLLTGQVVFPGGSMIQKLDRHRWHAPPAVEQLRPDVTPALAMLVARLLAKGPEQRMQTPGELALALTPFLETLPEPNAGCVMLGHRDGITGVAFLPDGSRCVSVSRDGTLRLWDWAAGQELLHIETQTSGLLCVAVAPDGRTLATGDGQGICLRETATGRGLRRLSGHGDAVTALAFSPDGRFLFSGSLDQTVRLWNVETGREARRIGGTVAERHWDGVLSVALAADGRRALSGSRDRTLHLWDLATGREVRCLRGVSQPVNGVAFAPDGRHALSTGGTTVRLWDVDTGGVRHGFQGHQRAVLCVAFAPHGSRAVSGGEDATVRVWDLATGRECCCFSGHAGAVTSVAFAPDGRSVLSGSADRSVRLWRLPD